MNTRSATSSSALPTTDSLPTSAGGLGRLTLQNLQRLNPAAPACQYPTCCATTSRGAAIHDEGDYDDDAEDSDVCSVFSAAASCTSTASSIQEDEDAPFVAADAWGVTVTVYASLEQAVLYSGLRASEDRRRERLSSDFDVFAPAPPSSHDMTTVDDDEDEDGYFSMG